MRPVRTDKNRELTHQDPGQQRPAEQPISKEESFKVDIVFNPPIS